MHNEYRSVVSSTTKQVTNRKQSSVNVMGLSVSTTSGYQSEKAYSLSQSPGSTTGSYRRWVNERLSDSDDNSDQERSDTQQKNVNSMPSATEYSEYTSKNLQLIFKDILEATGTLNLPRSELEVLTVKQFIAIYKDSLIKADKELRKSFSSQPTNLQTEIKRQLRIIGLLKKACETEDFNTLHLISQHLPAIRNKTCDGGSFLCDAAGLGSLWLCERLLEMGIEVDERAVGGAFTPLQRASFCGHKEVVQLLLEREAYVNNKSLDGKYNTAMHLAASMGHDQVVQTLISYGGHPEETNEMGHTPLMEAAAAGHVAVALCLVKHGAAVLNNTMEFKETAFTLAALKGQLYMVEFLLSNVEKPEEKVEEMHTALMGAAMGGHIHVAKYLLHIGAKVSLKVDNFETPLTLSAGGGHVEFSKLMLDNGSCIEETNDHGYTSLMEAAKENHLEMLEFLLSRGANTDVTTKGGEDAFLLACKHGNTDIVQCLAKHNVPIDKEGELGHTPLMWAAKLGHFSTVQFLVNDYADVNKCTNNNDTTVLSAACSNGSVQIVHFLLTHNADPLFRLKDGTTMLIEAAKGGHADIVKLLFGWLNSSQLTDAHFYEEEEEEDEDGGEDDDDDDDDDDLDDDVQPLQLTSLQSDHVNPLIPYIDSNSDKSQHSQAPAHSHHQLSSIIFSDNSDNDDDDDDDDDDEDDDEEDETADGADNSSLKTAKSLKSSVQSSSFVSSRIEWKTDQIERNPELQKLLRLHVRKDKARTLSCGSDSILPSSRWRNVVHSSHSMVDKEGSLKGLKTPSRKTCSSDVHYCSDKACSMCGCMKAVKQMEVEKKKVGKKRGEETCVTPPEGSIQGKLTNCNLHCLYHQHSTGSTDHDVFYNREELHDKTTKSESNLHHHSDEMHSTTAEVHSTTPSSKHSPSKHSLETPTFEIDAQTESNQETALTLASSLGYADFVYLLLSKGSNIEHRDRKGFTSLLHAASAGHFKIVKMLLRAGADIEVEAEKSKDTALSLACANGHAKIVDLLIRKGADIEHRNIEDYTPLSHAAAKGHVKIIGILLLYGAEINSRTNSKFGMSPLMLAAMYGHADAVSILLDKGGDVNAQNEIHRTTALSLACFNGKHEIVSLLADRKANLEHRAKAGLTPLMEAAQGGFIEVGKILLERGADVGAMPISSSRDTALGIAAEKGHFRFVELLLSKNAPIDVKNKRGCTPLWLACNSGHLWVVKTLVQHCADPDSVDNRKISCMVAALKNGHIKIVKLLVEHVSQLPPDPECVKYRKAIFETEKPDLIDKCLQCLEIIKKAKEAQAMKAYENAVNLLDELQQEQKMEAKKRAAKDKKREKKKQRKKDKTALTTTNDKSGHEESTDILKLKSTNAKEMDGSEEERTHSFNISDEDIFEKENKPKCIVKTVKSTFIEKSKQKLKLDSNNISTIMIKEINDLSKSSKLPKKKISIKNAINVNTTNSPVNTSLPLQISKMQHENCMEVIKREHIAPVIKSKVSSISDLDDFGCLSMPPPTNIIVAPVLMSSASLSKVLKSEPKSKSSTESTPQRRTVPFTDSRILSTNSTSLLSSTPSSQLSNYNDTSNCLLSTPSYSKVTTVYKSTMTSPATTSSSVKPFARRKLPTSFPTTSIPPITTYYASNSYKKEETTLSNAYNTKEQLKNIKKIGVPAKAVSRVIGRGGCNINAIREFSGAKIDLDKLKTSDDAVVTIKGLGDSILKASELISALIREADKDIDQLIAIFKQQLLNGCTSLVTSYEASNQPSFWKRTNSLTGEGYMQKPLSTASTQGNLKEGIIPTKNVWENRKMQSALAEQSKSFVGANLNNNSNNNSNELTTVIPGNNAWMGVHKMPTPAVSEAQYHKQVLISNLDMSGSNVWDNSMADGIGGQSVVSSGASNNEKPQLITTFPIGAWKSVDFRNNRNASPNHQTFQKPVDHSKPEKDINDWVRSVNSSNNLQNSQALSIATSTYASKYSNHKNATFVDSNTNPILASKESTSDVKSYTTNNLPPTSLNHQPVSTSASSTSTSHQIFNFSDVASSSSQTIREYSPFGGVLFNNAPILTKNSTKDMIVDQSKAPGYRPPSMISRTSPISCASALSIESQPPSHYNENAPSIGNINKTPSNVEIKANIKGDLEASTHRSLFNFDSQSSPTPLHHSIKQEGNPHEVHMNANNSHDSNISPTSSNAVQQPNINNNHQTSMYPFNLDLFLSSQQKHMANDITTTPTTIESNSISQSQQMTAHENSSTHMTHNHQGYISQLHQGQSPLLNSEYSNQQGNAHASTNSDPAQHPPPKHYNHLSIPSLSSTEAMKQAQLQPIGTERNSKKQNKFNQCNPPSISMHPSIVKHNNNDDTTSNAQTTSNKLQSNHPLINNINNFSSNSINNNFTSNSNNFTNNINFTLNNITNYPANNNYPPNIVNNNNYPPNINTETCPKLSSAFIPMQNNNYQFSEPWNFSHNNANVHSNATNYHHTPINNNDLNPAFLYNNINNIEYKNNQNNNSNIHFVNNNTNNLINRCNSLQQMMTAGGYVKGGELGRPTNIPPPPPPSLIHPRINPLQYQQHLQHMHIQQQLQQQHHIQQHQQPPSFQHRFAGSDADSWYLRQNQTDQQSWSLWTQPENK